MHAFYMWLKHLVFCFMINYYPVLNHETWSGTTSRTFVLFLPKLILAAICHALITMNIHNEIEELYQHYLNSWILFELCCYDASQRHSCVFLSANISTSTSSTYINLHPQPSCQVDPPVEVKSEVPQEAPEAETPAPEAGQRVWVSFGDGFGMFKTVTLQWHSGKLCDVMCI